MTCWCSSRFSARNQLASGRLLHRRGGRLRSAEVQWRRRDRCHSPSRAVFFLALAAGLRQRFLFTSIQAIVVTL